MGLRSRLPAGARRAMKLGRVRFFEALGSERYSRPGLFDLDQKLAAYLPRSGVFLEIGANDGYSQSNTYSLERIRGWSGILVEPLPRLAAICRRMRRRSHCVNVACVARPGAGPIKLLDVDLMSTVVTDGQPPPAAAAVTAKQPKIVAVETRTLSEVIDASPYDEITFMSVDVEGAELDVLAGLEFDRHAPTWLLVETEDPDEVERFCVDRGYRLVERLTYHDYLFTRQPG